MVLPALLAAIPTVLSLASSAKSLFGKSGGGSSKGDASGSGRVKQASLETKLQKELAELINKGLISGEGPLGDIFGSFNEEQFQQGIQEPSLKNFQENILPQLMEKFNSQNALQSGAFQKAKFKAGTDLQSDLNKLRYGAQEQNKLNRLTGLQTGLAKQGVENIVFPQKTSTMDALLQGLVSNAGPLLEKGASGFGDLISSFLNPKPGTSGSAPVAPKTTVG
jgi:hypothetical protein